VKIEIRGVERLSFRERQVVVLKEMGLATGEITKRLGLGASTVATLYNRARAKGYEVVIILPGDVLGIGSSEGEEGGE
jgi:DNA-directed RNA polymerase specialized sigma24 family protein